jgi:hypothetical protein
MYELSQEEVRLVGTKIARDDIREMRSLCSSTFLMDSSWPVCFHRQINGCLFVFSASSASYVFLLDSEIKCVVFFILSR